MADYNKKPTGNIRKAGTDPKLLTTGMGDTVSSVESRELKQNDSRKALQNLKLLI